MVACRPLLLSMFMSFVSLPSATCSKPLPSTIVLVVSFKFMLQYLKALIEWRAQYIPAFAERLRPTFATIKFSGLKHLSALNKYFWKYKIRLTIGVVFIVVSNYFGVLAPQLTGFIIDFV